MNLGSGLNKLVRIAMFIDGGFFNEVSNFYKFQHHRHSRLSIGGIQEFIRSEAARVEDVQKRQCQIVESHYFRGRFSADSASQAGKLEDERRFEDVLIRAGVIQHYLHLDENRPRPFEKGIDVWLSLEAFDLAVHKNFEMVALLAGDGDYVPLVRKLIGVGTRVMLLGWNFEYEYETMSGEFRRKTTWTDTQLIDVSTYPILMDRLIDDQTRRTDPHIDGLFVN